MGRGGGIASELWVPGWVDGPSLDPASGGTAKKKTFDREVVPFP